jgi:glycine cleavage system transcriptional repressor
LIGMERAVVTAVGVDRRGIVAALAGALTDLGCNLEDSTMSLLGGNFAVRRPGRRRG